MSRRREPILDERSRPGTLLLGFEGDGLAQLAIDDEPDDVVAAVVAGDVKGATGLPDARYLDVCDEQAVLLMKRIGDSPTARLDDHRVTQGRVCIGSLSVDIEWYSPEVAAALLTRWATTEPAMIAVNALVCLNN